MFGCYCMAQTNYTIPTTLSIEVTNEYRSVGKAYMNDGECYFILLPITITNIRVAGIKRPLETMDGEESTNWCDAKFELTTNAFLIGPGPQWITNKQWIYNRTNIKN